ncbi:hypothetical protein ACRXCV_05040 [Halobacteriovorax sp. GFR7]|uniref:hypothetical protein n=1 Tax=unclassified Halobacteriovorax TaxID=2639665 RepID=UPI003D950F32
MIDTARFGIRFDKPDLAEFYHKLINLLDSIESSDKFIVEKKNYPYFRMNELNRVYKKTVKIKKDDYYIFIQYKPLRKFKNAYAIKVSSELSNFENFKAFFEFFLSIHESSLAWKEFLNLLEIVELHFKLDIKEKTFDFFRESLVLNFSKSPFILKNIETGRRTYYVSKSLYLYEKEGFVRLEKRLKGKELKLNMYQKAI